MSRHVAAMRNRGEILGSSPPIHHSKRITQTYGLKQKDVARLLGVTQTAVSKYTRHIRGTVFKIEDVEDVQPTIEEIVVSLVNGRMSKYELVAKFCVACEIIRRKALMCELCRLSDPSIDVDQCFVCHLNTHSVQQTSKSEG